MSFDGTDLTSIGALEPARRRALVTQSGRTDIPFPVHEVVEIGRYPWSRTPQAAQSAAITEESMAECDLLEIRDRPFSQLSGGQQARVSLARALAQHAGILMLDEPTAALDIHHQECVLALLAKRRAAGAAVLMVVHDLSLAAAYANRVILMKAGQMVATGPTESVMTPELCRGSTTIGVDVDSSRHRVNWWFCPTDRIPRPQVTRAGGVLPSSAPPTRVMI
ncbi:UNVERIFIED_CONTAM: ABC-type cobalamin/Fe3+-siderophores transport system ATPase subunit [Williamsia faeni]